MKNQPVIMDTPTKLLACLSYFSILFMPVLFPLIAWLAATHIQQPAAKPCDCLPREAGLLVVIIANFIGHCCHYHHCRYRFGRW